MNSTHLLNSVAGFLLMAVALFVPTNSGVGSTIVVDTTADDIFPNGTVHCGKQSLPPTPIRR